MSEAALRLITVKTASWILMRRVRCSISAPLIEMVGDDQGVTGVVLAACGAGAGHLPDGAAPLQLKLGQVALEPGAREKPRVEPTQRQVDDRRQVRVVAAHPVAECRCGERECSEEAQRAGQRRTGVGQR